MIFHVPMRPLGLFDRRLPGATRELIDGVDGAGVAGGFPPLPPRGDESTSTSLEMPSMSICPCVVWRLWRWESFAPHRHRFSHMWCWRIIASGSLGPSPVYIERIREGGGRGIIREQAIFRLDMSSYACCGKLMTTTWKMNS